MIEILSENFGANETKTFMFQGGYIEILDAQYPVNVYLMDRSGGQISTMRNAEASFFSRPGPFECVQINSPTAQTVRFFVGSGDAGTRRASGVVQVVDGAKSKTIAGQSFSHWTQQGNIAANYSAVQLWNPPGSGVRLIVKKVTLASTVSTGFFHAAHNAALGAETALQAQSKLLGGAVAALGRMRGAAAAATVGTNFALSNAAVNTGVVYQPPEPVVVPPGWGHTIWGNTVNSDISATWDWNEDVI